MVCKRLRRVSEMSWNSGWLSWLASERIWERCLARDLSWSTSRSSNCSSLEEEEGVEWCGSALMV